MARISSYPKDSTIQDKDAWIGTESTNRVTRNFTAEDVANYVITSTSGVTGSGTLNTIPIFTGPTTIGDSFMTYNPANQFFNISKRLQIDGDLIVDGRGNFNGDYLRVNCLLQDGSGLSGTAGQVLSSTGTGVAWTDNTATGTVTGTGTTNNLPIWSDGPSGVLGDSQLLQEVNSNGLYKMTFNNANTFVINKPSSVTSFDPDFMIRQDNVAKVSMGWDDDGGGFGFLYNWAGDGWRFGSQGNNPELTIVTTAGNEGVTIANNLSVNGDATVFGPSRFLNNITINDEYTLPSADGTADQIITTDGAGQLNFVDQSTINAGNAEHVVIYTKNTSGSQIDKGTPVYITGTVGATDTVEIAPADAGNSSKMPAVGLLDDTLANNAFGYVITGGFMDNIATDPIDGATPSSNDTVYVKVGGGLTLTKPTGPTSLIQNVAKVGKVSGGNAGSLIVSSILRTNDVPNLTTGRIWVGDSNTIESQTVFIDEANNRLGVNTATPVTNLHVQGGIRITGSVDLFQQHENAFAGTNAGNQGTIIGAFNAAFGKNAMAAALSASNNAAVGYNALNALTGGNNNVAFGSGAGSSILNGSFNVALGVSALPAAINTQSNIAIGYNAQESNTSGNNNIAIGRNALGTMSTNFSNTVIGTDAAKLTTSMNRAVVIGSEALGAGTAGSDVVLVGNQAGQNNTAQWTVAIGSRALQTNTNGAFNTAVGGQALSAVTGGIGRQNVGLGYQAGNNITTGQNDIVIGFQAQASSATANNEITLGNSSISVLRCAVTTITSLSDERDKTDITNLEYGLDFINSLSPKQFTWDQRPEYAIEIDDDGNETQVEVENANKGKKDFGFIAQDVQSVDNDILRLVYAENPEKLEMSYGKLVPILVQAIKDLTNRIEALEA